MAAEAAESVEASESSRVSAHTEVSGPAGPQEIPWASESSPRVEDAVAEDLQVVLPVPIATEQEIDQGDQSGSEDGEALSVVHNGQRDTRVNTSSEDTPSAAGTSDERSNTETTETVEPVNVPAAVISHTSSVIRRRTIHGTPIALQLSAASSQPSRRLSSIPVTNSELHMVETSRVEARKGSI